MSRKIALISDTHGYLGEDLMEAMEGHDELWHAGDVGTYIWIDAVQDNFEKIRIVYGNIDGHEIRSMWKKDLLFTCEGVKVFMTHIGGYPGRYNKRVRAILESEKPDLYICGHSHILKLTRDNKLGLLHMNPGACGHHGFHFVRTLISFVIEEEEIRQVKVIELGKRGRV